MKISFQLVSLLHGVKRSSCIRIWSNITGTRDSQTRDKDCLCETTCLDCPFATGHLQSPFRQVDLQMNCSEDKWVRTFSPHPVSRLIQLYVCSPRCVGVCSGAWLTSLLTSECTVRSCIVTLKWSSCSSRQDQRVLLLSTRRVHRQWNMKMGSSQKMWMGSVRMRRQKRYCLAYE